MGAHIWWVAKRLQRKILEFGFFGMREVPWDYLNNL